MTVASPSSRELGAVEVDGMLEHFGKEGFVKNPFFAAVNSRHRRSCIPGTATSGHPSIV